MASMARRTFCWKSPLRGGIDLTFACAPKAYDELVAILIGMERQHYQFLDAMDEGGARVLDALRLNRRWMFQHGRLARRLRSYGVERDVMRRWFQEECRLYRYRWMCDRQPWRVIPGHPCFDEADSARPLLQEDEG